jgi:hypothetical protein
MNIETQGISEDEFISNYERLESKDLSCEVRLKIRIYYSRDRFMLIVECVWKDAQLIRPATLNLSTVATELWEAIAKRLVLSSNSTYWWNVSWAKEYNDNQKIRILNVLRSGWRIRIPSFLPLRQYFFSFLLFRSVRKKVQMTLFFGQVTRARRTNAFALNMVAHSERITPSRVFFAVEMLFFCYS